MEDIGSETNRTNQQLLPDEYAINNTIDESMSDNADSDLGYKPF